ncbi:6880_t:CDS:2, partial [Gigaspora margarita]
FLVGTATIVAALKPSTSGRASLDKSLAEKCPYYKAVQSGEKLENIDWSTNKCPAAGKCPYFEDVKKKAEANDGKLPSTDKGCPYAENCPHAVKRHEHKDGDESKCPYLSGDMKGCPYLSGERKDEKEAAAKSAPN